MFANFVEMRDFKEQIGLRGSSQHTTIASQDRQQPLRNLQIFPLPPVFGFVICFPFEYQISFDRWLGQFPCHSGKQGSEVYYG